MNKKTVFITGSSGTLGKELVLYYLKKKYKVLATTRNASKAVIKSKNLEIYKIDITKDKDIKKLINILNKKKIIIDSLINNSAMASGSLTEMTPIKTLKSVFEVNFFSQVKVIQNLLRFLKKSNNPCILNIGSISGLMPEKGFLSYGASKCALMYSTKIMALEFKRHKIRVNAIAPGIFKSNMSDKMDKKSKQKLLSKSSSKKIIKIKRILNLIHSILSSNKINGKIVKIN